MNNHFKALKILVFLALAGTSILANAQDDGPDIPPERMKEIKAQKSAFITQRLGLSTEEARMFWPVYDRFEADLSASRKDMREDRKGRRPGASMTEDEASKVIAADLRSKQDQLDIRKRYIVEFIKCIGAVKTVQLEQAERDFNRELLKRIRNRNAGDRRP